MIPTTSILTQQIADVTYPNRTYAINFNKKNQGVTALSLTAHTSNLDISSEDMDRISGYVDGLESVIQTIYLILMTERYKHIIYSWDYGVELLDLYGQPMPYVMSELPRRITEALLTDDRIESVTDFEFERNGKQLLTTFTVISNVGSISAEMEVTV